MDKFEAEYDYVTNDGPLVVFHTDKNAPLYRLVTINLEKPDEVSCYFIETYIVHIIYLNILLRCTYKLVSNLFKLDLT